jgi:hypothetical protein
MFGNLCNTPTVSPDPTLTPQYDVNLLLLEPSLLAEHIALTTGPTPSFLEQPLLPQCWILKFRRIVTAFQ